MKAFLYFIFAGPQHGKVVEANPLVLIAIAVAMLIVSYIITAMLMPKPPKNKPASLEDFEMPQHEEGTPEAVIFGEGWTQGPQVLTFLNLRTSKIKAEGGK